MAKKEQNKQTESGSSHSLGVRIGALILAGVLIFGTLIVTAIYMW